MKYTTENGRFDAKSGSGLGRCLSKTKKKYKDTGKVIRNKEKRDKIWYNTGPPVWPWMLSSFFRWRDSRPQKLCSTAGCYRNNKGNIAERTENVTTGDDFDKAKFNLPI